MKRFNLALVGLLAAHLVSAQSDKKAMKLLIDDNMQFAAKQYKVLASKVPATLMPRSYNAEKDSLVTSNTKWWCSGFYPGTLWMIYDGTKDAAIKEEAEKRLGILEKEKTYTGNHDLGFMMFCSFGTAYSITRNPAYKGCCVYRCEFPVDKVSPFYPGHPVVGFEQEFQVPGDHR